MKANQRAWSDGWLAPVDLFAAPENRLNAAAAGSEIQSSKDWSEAVISTV